MQRQFQHPQPSLFDENEPRVELAPALMVELATLMKVLLLEIATVLANGEIDNDQEFWRRWFPDRNVAKFTGR
jgi:hypothetical protein